MVFAGAGNVAAEPRDFSPGKFKHPIGVGLRYMLVEDAKANARIDFGFGQGSSEFAIFLTEAF